MTPLIKIGTVLIVLGFIVLFVPLPITSLNAGWIVAMAGNLSLLAGILFLLGGVILKIVKAQK